MRESTSLVCSGTRKPREVMRLGDRTNNYNAMISYLSHMGRTNKRSRLLGRNEDDQSASSSQIGEPIEEF